jgi:RNA 2',3'-cyclic 3'-phosphodiesterase
VKRRKLFIGIVLDDAVRGACASIAQRLERSGVRARFEAAEKLHITLAFLGYVDANLVDEIQTAIVDVAARHAALGLELDRVGAFPQERRPRIIFVGARDQGAAFRALARDLRAMELLGFQFKTDAVAHVTIARIREADRKPLPLLSEISPIPLRVAALSVFESLPDPARQTTRYEVIFTAPLSGARANEA